MLSQTAMGNESGEAAHAGLRRLVRLLAKSAARGAYESERFRPSNTVSGDALDRKEDNHDG